MLIRGTRPRGQVSQRRFRAGGRAASAVAVLLALVAGCTGGRGDEATGPGTRAETRAETPRAGGEQHLVVGERGDTYETEGPQANVAQYPVNANVYEGLVRMTPGYRIEPALATSWQFKAPNTWRFTLREGVTFHNGAPFTADAVKYSFDRIAAAGGGAVGFGKDSTRVVDAGTVEVTPTFPNHRLIEHLVHPEAFILAPGTTPGKETIGTGPFRFVRYTPKRELVVDRYEDYWGGMAQLERITFRFLPHPDDRHEELEDGHVDVIVDVPPDAVSELEAKGFVTESSEVGSMEAMLVNVKGTGVYAITRDRAVRTAIEYAIDRDQLVRGVFAGTAKDEQTMVPARLLGTYAKLIKSYEYDEDRPKEILDLAGWKEGPRGVREKDGQPLRLELISGFPSARAHGSVPEFIQGQLEAVGIAVDVVRTPDTAAYLQRLKARRGHLWLEQRSQNDANPPFLPALLLWSKGLLGQTEYQSTFAAGGRFDDLIAQALTTPDSEEARRLTAEAMTIIINQEAVVVPLAGLTRITGMTDRVQGFEPHPSLLQVRYDDVRLTG